MDVQMPDGTVIQDVPDGVTKAQLTAKYAAHISQNTPGAINGAARAISRGVPVIGSFLDEADAGLNTGLNALMPQSVADAFGIQKLKGNTLGENYQDALNQQRGMDQTYDAAHPVLSPVLRLAGGVASGGAALRAAPTAARAALGLFGNSLRARAAASAASGAVLGGATGFGDGQGDFRSRLGQAGAGAATGAVLGAALPTISRAAGRGAAALLSPTETAPTTAELRNQAQALYKSAGQSGLVISGDSFQNAMQKVAADAQEAGIDPTLHPKATAVLARLTGAAGDPGTDGDLTINDVTLNNAGTLRRVVNAAGGSNDADERRIVRGIRDGFDDYMQNLGPDDLVGGTPDPQALQNLNAARTLWAKQAKSSIIDGMMQRAQNSAGQYSVSGLENGIRTQFRNLAQNDARMRRFSPDEQNAIRQVARGGNMQNLVRLVGKLAPTSIVGGGAGIGLGASLGGPLGAAAVSGTGLAAKLASRQMTLGNANAVSDLIRRGSAMPVSPLANKTAGVLQGLLGASAPAQINRGILALHDQPSQ